MDKPSPQPSPRGRGRRDRHQGEPKGRPAADARELAWEILQDVERGGFADALLGSRLRRSALPERDLALLTRLVYGTLAWQGYLDHIIAAFSRWPPHDLDLPVRTLLRLALFQTCRLTRIPSFAAVNTAVQLIKRHRGGAAVGFVNAVLRRAVAGWRGVMLPAPDADLSGYLATRLSHPRWLVERWLAQYGTEETAALLEANNEPAPTVLRVNRRRIDRAALLALLREAGHAAEPTLYSPSGIRIEHGGGPERLPGYAEGLFSLQGEASQLVGLLLAPRPGDRVLDACAAPGGKATHLAELMEDCGQVVALDVNPRGVERIRGMAHRLGVSSVQAVVGDATTWRDVSPASYGSPVDGSQCVLPAGPFDCVLIDAPCSGLGTLRQHPELRWRRTPEDIAGLARLQRALLGALAAGVRPGGVLVYATCTLSAPENEELIAAFLREHPDFAPEDPRPHLPNSVHQLIGSDSALRTFPHRHGLDGFFAVQLKRLLRESIVGACS